MKVFCVSPNGELPPQLGALAPAWLLVYATEDVNLSSLLGRLAKLHPGVDVFGCTSYQGVFVPSGFVRGAAILAGESGDGLETTVVSRAYAGSAREEARSAAMELASSLGGLPQLVLLHATPGQEESVLSGLEAGFGSPVPVYGGSAADDRIAGRWRVFGNHRVLDDGFVVTAFASSREIQGAFLGGFLPTQHTGRITKCTGRTVFEIDGKPAASVYNTWTEGRLEAALRSGGSLVEQSTCHPVGRVVGQAMGMPRRLLSHPHEVDARTGALTFFSEFEQGDEVALMACAEEQLVTRIASTADRARRSLRSSVGGGIFVYCGGSLSAIVHRATDISTAFANAVDDAPFIGVATFGEQGWFFDRKGNRHGNLMCTSVLFGR